VSWVRARADGECSVSSAAAVGLVALESRLCAASQCSECELFLAPVHCRLFCLLLFSTARWARTQATTARRAAQQRLWRERLPKKQHQLSTCNSYGSDAWLALLPLFLLIVCVLACFWTFLFGRAAKKARLAPRKCGSRSARDHKQRCIARTSSLQPPLTIQTNNTTALTLRKFNATLHSTERHTSHAYSCCC